MIFGVDQVKRGDGPLGGLTTQLRVRVLNASASGCLVEAPRALPVGTVAHLRVRIFDREYDDQVRVTRCQILAGAGSIFHIAMQFLTTVPPYAESLRYAIHRELHQLAGWVHVADDPDTQPADSSRRRAADATDE